MSERRPDGDPIEHYSPSPETLEALRQVRLVSVIGPTAVGKTSLLEAAATADGRVHRVVPETSRPPRPGEVNGVDYHFSTHDQTLEAARGGDFVQIVRNPTGHLYATRLDEYPPDKVSTLPVIADAIDGFRELPFGEHRSIYLLPPSFAAWHERLEGRFDDKQGAGRLAEARSSLEFAATDPSLNFVIGDELDRATQDFLTLAHGQEMSTALWQDQATGRLVADQL